MNEDEQLSTLRRRMASFFLFSIQQPLRDPMTPNSHFSVTVDPERTDYGDGEQGRETGQYPQISRQR